MADVRNLFSRLLKFGRTNNTAEVIDDNARANSEAVAPAAGWDDVLHLSLGNLVEDTETRASGRVQVLTLAHLRIQLGEYWERYRSRVELIAENTIGRMIGKGNTYIQQDGDSWLLLMPSIPENEAQRKADEIAAVIGEKLIGERFTEQEPPWPQTEKIDLGSALNQDGSLNVDALQKSVKRTRLILAARDARRPVKTIAAAVDGNKGKSNTSPLDTPTAGARSNFERLTLVYRPSWSADTQSIDTFSLRAFDSLGDSVFAPTAMETGGVLNDATMVDIAKAAFADFTTMVQSGLRARYVIPLPFPMMRRKIGAVFLRAVWALPQKERLLHLRVELVGVPKRADIDHLIDVREMFRGRVREVAILTDLEDSPTAIFMLDHIVIGGQLTTTLSGDALNEALTAFRRRAGTRRAYVTGLLTRTDIGHAVKIGFDEVSGPGLGDDHRALPDKVTIIHRDSMSH